MTRSPRARRGRPWAALLSAGLLSLCAMLAVSCKRTWDNCWDPGRDGPPCMPTIEVINCANPPQPCSTPGTVVSACAYCNSGGISGCAGPDNLCQNALCYRISTLAFGATIRKHRVYRKGDPPSAWATPMGGPVPIERAKQGPVVNYTWCGSVPPTTMTPVVGLSGIPVIVESEVQLDDRDLTVYYPQVEWRQ